MHFFFSFLSSIEFLHGDVSSVKMAPELKSLIYFLFFFFFCGVRGWKGGYIRIESYTSALMYLVRCADVIPSHNSVSPTRGPQLKFTLKSNLIFFTFRPFFSLIYFFYFFFLCFFFFTFFALFSLFSYFPSFIVTFSHFFSFFSFLYFYIAYGKAFGSRWQTLIKSHSPCWGFFYD